MEKRSSFWVYIFSILGALVATFFAVLLAYALYAHYFATFKKRVVNILLHTLPEPVVSLIRQQPVPVVDPVPPPVQQPLLGAAV